MQKNVAFLYGHRPRHPEVWYLSPYEFVCYWEPVLAEYPASADENGDEEGYHAKLTAAGQAKLREATKSDPAKLKPGTDCEVKEWGGAGLDAPAQGRAGRRGLPAHLGAPATAPLEEPHFRALPHAEERSRGARAHREPHNDILPPHSRW